MVKKAGGYILSLSGIFGFIITLDKVSKKYKIKFPLIISKKPEILLSKTAILIISGVLFLIGIVLLAKNTSQKRTKKGMKKVPIYHKGEVVGYELESGS